MAAGHRPRRRRCSAVAVTAGIIKSLSATKAPSFSVALAVRLSALRRPMLSGAYFTALSIDSRRG
jgi:hypothetical protein